MTDKALITVDTAQNLRDLTIYNGLYPECVVTLGALTAGDGGGGSWRLDAASVANDNIGTVLLPTGHTGAGRWVRLCEQGYAHVDWFGTYGNRDRTVLNATANLRAIRAAAAHVAATGGGTVEFGRAKQYCVYVDPGDGTFGIFPYSNMVWEFNFCDLIPLYRGDTYNLGIFQTDAWNPLIGGKPRESGYGSDNPALPGIYTDEDRPLDTTVLIYPIGTTKVLMESADHGLVPGDFVYFFSGACLELDWSNYQKHDRELKKIAAVDGAEIYFTTPTVMNHRLLQPTAYAPGESQYGTIAYWGLHKLQDLCVTENLIFRNLRATMTLADQAVWPTINDYTRQIFNPNWCMNITLENCHIITDKDAIMTNNYIACSSGVKHLDCVYAGNHRITFGYDQANSDHLYSNVKWLSTTDGVMRAHNSERAAKIHFKRCTMVFNSTIGGDTVQSEGLNEDIVYEDCVFHNNGWVPGARDATGNYFGDMRYERCRFTGRTPNFPVTVKHPDANIIFRDCIWDQTFDSYSNQGMLGGAFIGNTVSWRHTVDGSVNNLGGNFWGSPTADGAPRKMAVANNIGIGDLADYVVSGDSFHLLSGAATRSTTEGLWVLDATTTNFLALSIPHLGSDALREKRALFLTIHARLNSVGNGAMFINVRVIADNVEIYDVSAAMDMAPFGAAPFVLRFVAIGGSRTTGKDLKNATVIIERRGGAVSDTSTNTLTLVDMRVRTARSDTVAWAA
jgi:hypothetical protein